MGNLQCCDNNIHKIKIQSSGQEFTVSGSLTDPILTIKTRISSLKKLPLRTISLIYNGKILTNQETLLQLQFRIDQDFLSLCSQSVDSKVISITIKNISFTQKIQIDTSDRVNDLKSKVQARVKIQNKKQRLIYNGIIMQDDYQIAKYGVKEGDIVHLALILAN